MSASTQKPNSFGELLVEGKFVQISYANTSVEGVVWSYAPEEGLVLLQLISANGDVDVAMIRDSEISDVQLVDKPQVPKKCTTLVKLDAVDVGMARKSEEKKVAAEKVKAEGINQSVPRAAQELYNRLTHLNISCAWDQQDIVIPASHIRIQPPYGPENCLLTGDQSFKMALDRVQKIVARK